MIELAVFGLVWGCSIAMMTLALGISWRVLRILDFGLAGVYAVAAYAQFLAIRLLEWPVWAGVLAALAAGVGIQCLAYFAVYAHFLRRKEGLATVVLLSLAVLYVLQNALILIFGSAGQMALMSAAPQVPLGGYTPPITDVVSVLALVVTVAALLLVFNRTSAGLTMKATADNAELAQTFGVSPQRIRLATFALAGLLASIPAAVGSLYEPVTPVSGFTPILFAFAAFVIAAVRKGLGIVEYAFAGLLLGLVTSVCLLVIPSKWQLAVPFAAMTLVTAMRRSAVSPLRAV